MREWLSGGAPPCQGGGRGFDPRLALQQKGISSWISLLLKYETHMSRSRECSAFSAVTCMQVTVFDSPSELEGSVLRFAPVGATKSRLCFAIILKEMFTHRFNRLNSVLQYDVLLYHKYVALDRGIHRSKK